MMGKRAKKPAKDGDKSGQQDGSSKACGSTSAGGRRAKKEKEKDLIDIAVRDLVLNMSECDNTDVPRREQFRRVVLVKYLQQNVESMYPQIGRETYRVPDVHINKGKEGEINQDGVSELIQPTDTDIRSDRAHSFVIDMVYQLSKRMKETKIGPFFIISSYEYDHFLSRLKASFDEKLCPYDVDVNFPNGSGHDRGEIDILIVLPKHVIFMEIKAIGDNFGDYGGDKLIPVRENIKKSTKQLLRDQKVFDHIMADLKLQDFKCTDIVALPNLERQCLKEALRDEDLWEKCQGIKFICKEDMPKSRLNFQEDFHVFYKWWIDNVFPEIYDDEKYSLIGLSQGRHTNWSSLSQQENLNTENEVNQMSPLDEIKIIVGRYIGFMSVVRVCNNSNTKLHRIEGVMEGRRKGQLVWYVGEKFANIVLTPDQKRYLDANIRLGYLCGPPGSGKTVVLSLRARRWILNDDNFVVVVNMYRGAPGRAIGKQILNTITSNSDKNKESFLKYHTMEIGVDVSVDKFNREEFVKEIKSRWKEDLGDGGQRVMFIVDETYVQSYWNTVFQALRQEFVNSAMWCAGLYGKQPDQFTSLELTKVIRCPPNVQHILLEIDWVDDRKKCYVTDSTTAFLPSNGPQVLTIRHQEHTEYVNVSPSQCPLCGNDLVEIFRKLQVRNPGRAHTEPDLRMWSLQCSEIILLVNMPRTLYSPDPAGFLDTTVDKYRDYMRTFQDCPMLQKLNQAGYPTKVHTNLSCSDLVTKKVQDVINVTWIYTYQGLENKVIIFLPGDEAMPDNCSESYFTEAALNIPCPGLMGSEVKEGQENVDMTGRQTSRGDSESGNSEGIGVSTDSDCSDSDNTPEYNKQRRQMENSQEGMTCQGKLCDDCWCSCEVEQPCPSGDEDLRETINPAQDNSVPFPEPKSTPLEERIVSTADMNRYTRWDKSNLFISGSRCTSQLILITR
uniref:Uncharacterized protein n=2 Tax=Arion vulgaris TaxID=1028688 RepID=A0A0B7B928_9EUPU